MLNAVVDDLNFVSADAVPADYDAPGKMADRDYLVRTLHALSFDIIDHLVDVLSAAVEFRRVDVNNKRFAHDCRHGDTGRIRHPVVGVNKVEVLALSQIHHKSGIAVDLIVHFYYLVLSY